MTPKTNTEQKVKYITLRCRWWTSFWLFSMLVTSGIKWIKEGNPATVFKGFEQNLSLSSVTNVPPFYYFIDRLSPGRVYKGHSRSITAGPTNQTPALQPIMWHFTVPCCTNGKRGAWRLMIHETFPPAIRGQWTLNKQMHSPSNYLKEIKQIFTSAVGYLKRVVSSNGMSSIKRGQNSNYSPETLLLTATRT